MPKKLISIDWFQYYCHVRRETPLNIDYQFKGEPHGDAHIETSYIVKGCAESHPIYRRSFTVKAEFGDICHIHINPKMSSLNPFSCCVKVANPLLYKRDWSFYLHDVLNALSIEIRNITRVDICIDFQYFDYQIWEKGGFYLERSKYPKTEAERIDLLNEGWQLRYLHPTEFIHNYLHDARYNDEETFIREGSNKFSVVGNKNLVPLDGSNLINDDTWVLPKSTFEYIRWGSRASGVCTYLYNKSLELRTKKSKPWIRQRWEEGGLDEKDGDIYRLEFSIQQKGMNLRRADKKKGMKTLQAEEVIQLSKDMLETQHRLEEVFWSYASKYFSFRRVGTQKYRKNMKQVQLFDFDLEINLLPCTLPAKINSGRAEFNASKCIERLLYKGFHLSGNEQFHLLKATEILERIGVEKKELNKQDFQKIEDFEEKLERGGLTQEQYNYINSIIYQKFAELAKFECDAIITARLEYLESVEQEAKLAIVAEEQYWSKYKFDQIYLNEVPF